MAFGLYLLTLAAVIIIKPLLAERFLKGFASSVRAHYAEQISRLITGIALTTFSPYMRYPDLFKSFGLIIIMTTLGLLIIPWKQHFRFSKWVIPLVIRNFKLYAFAAFSLGIFVLYAASGTILPF